MRFLGLTVSAGVLEICLANQTPLTAPTHHGLLDEAFGKRVEWLLEHYNTPGLAVAVVEGDKTFARGYGLSDIKSSKPVTEYTLFYAGSTSKAATAAAVSLLVDDPAYPEIQWDTPVHSIIPEDFSMIDPWYTAHVTIRDILSHRSGLPRHDYMIFTNLTTQEIVRSIRHLPLTAEIRTKFQYNNNLYVTAGYLVEKVTGQSLPDFLTERIWGPLNMSETYLSQDEARKDGRDISLGYFPGSKGNLVALSPSIDMANMRGAGAVLTSVHDYAKWVSAFLDRGPPFSPAGYSALLGANTIIVPEAVLLSDSPSLYSMGWFLETYRGERVFQHGGAQWGFGALVMFLPKRGLGIVVLGNTEIGTNAVMNILAYDIIDRVLDTPAHERFDLIKKTDEALENLKLSNKTLAALYPDLPDTLLPHPLDLSAYEGKYVHPALPDIQLSADCPDRHPPPKPRTVDWRATLAATRVEFRVDSHGRVSQLGIEEDLEMLAKGEKVWWDRV